MTDHHPPCPGGCGELADECACARPLPLGSMGVHEPIGSILPVWCCGVLHYTNAAYAAHRADHP